MKCQARCVGSLELWSPFPPKGPRCESSFCQSSHQNKATVPACEPEIALVANFFPPESSALALTKILVASMFPPYFTYSMPQFPTPMTSLSPTQFLLDQAKNLDSPFFASLNNSRVPPPLDLLPKPKSNRSKPETKTSSETRIKRPMNAFMVWSQMRRAEITSAGGKVHNSDISKMLGKEWKSMKEDEKTPFVIKAREIREEHFREHPDYVYRPRRRKTLRKPSKPAEESAPANVADTPPTTPNLLPALLLNQMICNHFIAMLSQNQPLLPSPP
ncbi:unnamed protein product [Caenorhabditis auriculariae]|uniref:Sex-determining region Y protein n=1 Tax=Caenorhabditis auriculariae TaxID=2777116 RepID=A0A8S1H2I2_9PELO|nr:unnamed protein product [Caenorhabditis auriculariae]